MKRKRLFRLGMLAAGALVALSAGFLGGATAQSEPIGMESRMAQLIAQLQAKPTVNTIAHSLEVVYGGARMVPTGNEAREQTEEAHKQSRQAALQLIPVLNRVALTAPDEVADAAYDTKLLIEEIEEVADAVALVTRRQECSREGADLNRECPDLHPLLNEETGQELSPGSHAPLILHRSYSVKLRSPFVPPTILRKQEDIRVTERLARSECAVVFKEHKGLMIRLHFERWTVVFDPWVPVFGVPRATLFPIWHLTWVPSQYVKTYSICNVDGRTTRLSVQQRVQQDRPLNFFWRYYPKDP